MNGIVHFTLSNQTVLTALKTWVEEKISGEFYVESIRILPSGQATVYVGDGKSDDPATLSVQNNYHGANTPGF